MYERSVIDTQQDHSTVNEARANDGHVVQLRTREFDIPAEERKKRTNNGVLNSSLTKDVTKQKFLFYY